ncbi:MAG: hypothetical protein A2527_04630 [Candidatus Lambdaproteobacteria bacterium RIFOXYD2_FULL_50_16]|uniref:Uncharacterized protein n=1 Tax=Candidatus Lambdaproteobacteria bacterium RIFOXYD2_FULL_50_16 TaxID=1817772 RepID=A0A1F6GDL2_9PROT|nr:MAG: hypothetical protein A2527_04630 [Candidatus Lambdaproteobacteria bacterium RIFOXYD2_FULL_50_16]
MEFKKNGLGSISFSRSLPPLRIGWVSIGLNLKFELDSNAGFCQPSCKRVNPGLGVAQGFHCLEKVPSLGRFVFFSVPCQCLLVLIGKAEPN